MTISLNNGNLPVLTACLRDISLSAPARELSTIHSPAYIDARYLKLILPLCRLTVVLAYACVCVYISVCLFIVPIWSRINFTPLYSSLSGCGGGGGGSRARCRRETEKERARHRSEKGRVPQALSLSLFGLLLFLSLRGFEPPRVRNRETGLSFRILNHRR